MVKEFNNKKYKRYYTIGKAIYDGEIKLNERISERKNMYKKRIIPCLDIKNGRVVKGINFVNLVDAGDPSEQAKIYSENGADEICFLDITASNENRDIILEVVKNFTKLFCSINSWWRRKNIKRYFKFLNSGADKVSINTAAVNDTKL